jgi:hypothetical protein
VVEVVVVVVAIGAKNCVFLAAAASFRAAAGFRAAAAGFCGGGGVLGGGRCSAAAVGF